MDVSGPRDLMRFFKELPDPRASNVSHPLSSLMAMALLGVLSRADDWIEVESWAQANESWLGTFLDLPHGVPSHDTFGRVFSLMDPDAFEACFRRWMAGMAIASNGKLIAIDGKTLRRSFEAAGGRAAIHMVSAWVQQNHAVLGQIQVSDKSNEITAIPRLLEVLDLHGATVTIDAMGCQKNIAAQIITGQGHYLLAVKENQRTLHEEIKLFMDEAIAGGWEHTGHSFHREVEADHGRIETRRCWATWDMGWFQDAKDWPGFASIVCVESLREVMGGKTTCERRYYISSHMTPASPPRMPSSWPGRCAATGGSRTVYIGVWTCAFKKTAAGFARSTLLRISRVYGGYVSTYCGPHRHREPSPIRK